MTLESSRAGHDSALVAATDGEGHFRFSEIQSGSYELTAKKNGFLDSAYGQVQPEDDQLLLTVSEGDQLQGITLQLSPSGTISGRVLDPDGDPIADREVILWIHGRARGKPTTSSAGQSTTNHEGEYRFRGLSPGEYYLSATADELGNVVHPITVDASGKPTNLHDFTTFYPAALGLTNAQPVSIKIGQEQLGVNIQVQRGAMLSVRGSVEGIAALTSKYVVSARVETGTGWTAIATEVLANGDFVFKELPPGKHELELLDRSLNGGQVLGATQIDLQDRPLAGVSIAPFNPAQVRVRVVIESAEDQGPILGSVFLSPSRDNENAKHSVYQFQPRDGYYLFEGIAPGKYEIGFTNAKGCYLKTVRSGDRTIDPESMEIGPGAALDLVMTYSRNVAAVSGDVENVQDQSGHAAHIFLVPVEPTSWTRRPDLDQSMHFSLENLAPGKYLAFAAEDGNPELWDNPEFVKLLQPEGAELDLHEEEHVNVHLKLIRKDDTERAGKRLGLLTSE